MADIKFVCDIDRRICEYISRGNEKAFNTIATYHMSEIKQLRNATYNIFRDKYLADITKLNQAFEDAVVSLGINLVDLLSSETTILSQEPVSVRKLA